MADKEAETRISIQSADKNRKDDVTKEKEQGKEEPVMLSGLRMVEDGGGFAAV